MKCKLTIASGFVAAALLGCSRAPRQWEYKQFEFTPRHERMLGGEEYNYIEFWDPDGKRMFGSNEIRNAEELLNEVGYYGWELTWTDGKRFIVKRPAGRTDGHFDIFWDFDRQSATRR